MCHTPESDLFGRTKYPNYCIISRGFEEKRPIYLYSFCQVIAESFQSTGFLFCDHIVWLSPSRLKRGKQRSPGKNDYREGAVTQDGVETLFCNKKNLGDIGHCNSLLWRYPIKIKWRKIDRRVPLWNLSRGDMFDIVAFQPALNIYSPEA